MSETRIELHGWDATSSAWHGPDELAFSLSGCRNLLNKLRQAPGSWYGHAKATGEDGLPVPFAISVHDIGDAGLGAIDLEDSEGGPIEVVLVVPPQRRSRRREELAFEFVSYLRFLEGPVSSGRELALHEYLEHTLAAAGTDVTLVFSIETRPVATEVLYLLSEQVEHLSMAMIAWMAEKDRLEEEVADAHAGTGTAGAVFYNNR